MYSTIHASRTHAGCLERHCVYQHILPRAPFVPILVRELPGVAFSHLSHHHQCSCNCLARTTGVLRYAAGMWPPPQAMEDKTLSRFIDSGAERNQIFRSGVIVRLVSSDITWHSRLSLQMYTHPILRRNSLSAPSPALHLRDSSFLPRLYLASPHQYL